MSNPILEFINLHNGEEEKRKVLENVASNTSFRGSNLWILACAIIIASVGLNVNSTAVIIGAMLISPLMGPIVGAGFALGTFDFALLKKSGKNLLIATIVSLLVSAIYFYISPFKDVQSELLARTAPNIYDVLIAFFGGLVGVIAIARVEKGNPIPGVAIATALMPPLCTAGYGLATLNFAYFFGAFYLYTINCFFICIATFIIVKYLNYPSVSFKNVVYEKYIRYGISTLIVVMIVPSFYLAYGLLNEKKFTKQVEQYINTVFANQGYTVIYKKLNYNSAEKKVELAFLNKKFSDVEISDFQKRLPDFGLTNTSLIIKQDDADLKTEILSELNKQDVSITQKDVTINNLRKELATYQVANPALISEIKILFSEIKSISIGRIDQYAGTDSIKQQLIILYDADKKVDEQKLSAWIGARLRSPNPILLKMDVLSANKD